MCFGCGPANRLGLGLRSFADQGGVVAEWDPSPVHQSGIEVVAGGVVGTLLDCHAGAAVFHAVWERDGRTPYVDGDPWVTLSYSVELLRPTPLDRSLHLRAEVPDLGPDRAEAVGSIIADDKATATITAEFRRLRPRT